MTSWTMIAADVVVLWAAVLIGFVWHGYWSQHDWDRDHHHR